MKGGEWEAMSDGTGGVLVHLGVQTGGVGG